VLASKLGTGEVVVVFLLMSISLGYVVVLLLLLLLLTQQIIVLPLLLLQICFFMCKGLLLAFLPPLETLLSTLLLFL
jgi:hypothetical protein